ncbi:MAG: hypothetical protein NTY19_45590, partial [Planctomycetota bacterium]|nr:hypothetical protein [Planctomycetota bacterium]
MSYKRWFYRTFYRSREDSALEKNGGPPVNVVDAREPIPFAPMVIQSLLVLRGVKAMKNAALATNCWVRAVRTKGCEQ